MLSYKSARPVYFLERFRCSCTLFVLSPLLVRWCKQQFAGQLDSTAFHDTTNHITACFATHCSQHIQHPIRQLQHYSTIVQNIAHTPRNLLPKTEYKFSVRPNCSQQTSCSWTCKQCQAK